MARAFRNPILTGFYPDPSICRTGDDFYLVTSTFEYFPGLPIFHSRDLVHWRQIGHVLDRPSQLPLDGIRASAGLYAPTIRYHDGVYYVINTLVDGTRQSGNFIVTATDPAGPWSEPYWLEGADGIDPSLFFDDDGTAWYVGTRLKAHNTPEQGQTEIWLQRLDLGTMRLVGEQSVIWDGAVKNAVWSESPHIYKIDGRYYLLTAEGGTAHHHAVMVARSDTITSRYEGNRGNPILTHRHLGLDYPIVGTGHADLVQTQTGEWWMVLLAMRPYGGYYYNLGRETFLTPIRWEDGWPIVNAGIGKIEFTGSAPDLPEHDWPPAPDRDDFDQTALALPWFFLRTPREDFWSLSDRSGWLRLRLRPERLSERVNPSFVGRRQQHIHFRAETLLEFSPQSEHECAGLALVQNDSFHFCFIVTQTDQPVIRLSKRVAGVEEILAEQPLSAGRVFLKIEAHEQAYHFSAATEPEQWRVIAAHVDGRILSTPVAGGFVGTVIALYASSNGQAGTNVADFDWFEYVGLDAA